MFSSGQSYDRSLDRPPHRRRLIQEIVKIERKHAMKKIGLRWWRDVLILSQPKRYLDDRWARKYWLVSFRKIR